MCEPQPEAPHPVEDTVHNLFDKTGGGGKGLDDTKQCRQEHQ